MSRPDPGEYHKRLGLEPDASTADIKRAYREMAKKYHPDINKEPDAHERFIEITEAYEIFLDQPLDHKDPFGSKFSQRIYLSHKDVSRPVVLVTEGYTAGHNFVKELHEILNANQIVVEHRYFGKSVPDSMDWHYLNIEQAARDHHRIVELFRKIYPGKWVNCGWSKGGQTAIFHRYFYPDSLH